MDRMIFESKYWKVELANKQLYLGRAKVTLKRECESLSKLTFAEWTDFHAVIIRFEDIVKNVFKATMFNWSCLMNLAYQEKKPKPKVHWHVRPRYNHPVKFAGEIFVDGAFGHHYDREKEVLSPDVSDELVQKIIDYLKVQLKPVIK